MHNEQTISKNYNLCNTKTEVSHQYNRNSEHRLKVVLKSDEIAFQDNLMASFVMEFPWTLNLPITFLVQCTLHCADILENSFTGCALSLPRPLLAYLSTVLSSKAPWQVHLSCPLFSLSNIFHSFPFVALPLPVYVGGSLRLCPELYLLTYLRSWLFLNLNLCLAVV